MSMVFDMLLTTVGWAILTSMSVRNFRFWQAYLGLRRTKIGTVDVVMAAVIFFLLNLSTLFFDDQFSRPLVAVVAAGTYYSIARLCSPVTLSYWRHRRLHRLGLAVLWLVALGLTFTPLSTPLLVLAFVFLTYREQGNFTKVLIQETCTDIHDMRERLRSLAACEHNSQIQHDVMGDNYHEAS